MSKHPRERVEWGSIQEREKRQPPHTRVLHTYKHMLIKKQRAHFLFNFNSNSFLYSHILPYVLLSRPERTVSGSIFEAKKLKKEMF